MKVLIIYHSEHHGNTEKIARAMADAVKAELMRLDDFNLNSAKKIIDNYDVIGFGSGIYSGKHHKSLLDFVSVLPENIHKKVFVFSTSGVDALSRGYHNWLKNQIIKKGLEIIGEFNCLGFDTALISSGINKGQPNNIDLENSKKFIKSIFNY